MDWIKRLFAVSGFDLSRVNSIGLFLMAVAVLAVALAGRVARKICPDAPDKMKNAIKIIALVICAGGALLAILG